MTRISIFLTSLLFAGSLFADSAQLDMLANQSNQLMANLAVVNRGPDVARNSFLTIDVPPDLVLDRVITTYGPCDYGQRPVRCSLGDIPVGLPAFYMGADFKAPFADATYTVKFTVTSDTPDPVPSTNTASVTFTTKLEADLVVLIGRASTSDRVDPGQLAQFWTFVGNNVRDSKPPNVRIDYAVTNGVIEKIDAPAASCSIGGATAVCTIDALPQNPGSITVSVRTTADRLAGKATLSMHATSDVPEKNPADNQTENHISIYQWYGVTTTADNGPGSLRDAIGQANAHCTPGPCRIVFEIPPPVPAEGWFTITPVEPFPAITADRVSVEGSRQKALTGDTNLLGPEVAIDGHLARRGLKIVSRCEAVIEGLALGNFGEDQGLAFGGGTGCPDPSQSDRRSVANISIGVDPTGTTPWPNLRGLNLDGAFTVVEQNLIRYNQRSGVWMWSGSVYLRNNLIENNGASGIFLGPQVVLAAINNNIIAGQRDMGIAVARNKATIEMRGNRMKDNGGLGIDWGLDGISPAAADDRNGPSNAPVLLSATYDPAQNRTLVTLSIKSTPLGLSTNRFGVIDFYGNRTPDGDGEQPLGSTSTDRAAEGTITVSVAGDLRGQWLNATWTRINALGNDYPGATSELSNAIFIERP